MTRYRTRGQDDDAVTSGLFHAQITIHIHRHWIALDLDRMDLQPFQG
jgi:hypothetical protein